MNEKPILFSAPMVRAILEGRKTQTRRIMKDADRLEVFESRPSFLHSRQCRSYCEYACGGVFFDVDDGRAINHDNTPTTRTPFGGPGDRLYVREAFAYSVKDPESHEEGYSQETHDIVYRATATNDEWEHYDGDGNRAKVKPPWKPGIHMPRWASRLTLEVTSVRVQRLQEITEEDAKAEGVTPFPKDPDGDCWADGTHRSAFEYLWGEINGFPGESRGAGKSWIENPWVWCVGFRRVKP